jgi:kynureninase
MTPFEVLMLYCQEPATARQEPSLLTHAEALDRADPLGHKRAEFTLPDQVIYLDGNSLGPLPIAASERARAVVRQQWGEDLITSWNKHGWIDLPQTVGNKIAPLLGAAPGQVICCDSISVNLFKLLAAALSLNPGRRKVLSQQDNFPTDLYVAQGLQQLLGAGRCDLVTVAESDLEAELDDSVAVLLLTQVNFRSGRAHDIRKLTDAAHSRGALVIWDLAHSAGVMPLALDQWQVDFAIGCGYKYLNGGPGAPAFIYAADRHQAALEQPLVGWMGHESPFDFAPDYLPAPGMRQFLTGTPPVLSMSVLDAALEVYRDIDIDQARDKALNLADYFAARVMESPSLGSMKLISPLAHGERGAQLAYSHADAYAICQALISVGVIADFRAPDILRLGFSPLYLGFQQVDEAVSKLEHIVANEVHRQRRFNRRQKVT